MANANKKAIKKPQEKKKQDKNYDIKVDTGATNVRIRDFDGEILGVVKINPTDVDIVERYTTVVDKFNNLDFGKDEKVSDEQMLKLSDMIKEQFDYLFNYSVSKVFFSKCSPLTIISDGDFYFENVFNNLAPVIEDIVNVRVQKKMKKIKKYTDKYAPKYHN